MFSKNQQTEALKESFDQKFNQSCEAAYQHYKTTGLHVTHEEVAAWLDSIGTDNELPIPVCHT
jgi:predicted transcriptional regulator